MRFKDKFIRTFEVALHWKGSPQPQERRADRQNRPPDEREAELAESRAENESVDGLEHELVGSAGSRQSDARNKS